MSHQTEKLVGTNRSIRRRVVRISLRLPILLLLVIGAGRAWAVDVPFSVGQTIDGSFGGAISLVTADVDGDGDLDVLGAGQAAGDITWWENLNGSGTSWMTHTIDGAFFGAISVHAADLDGDGDVDLLGAASDADAITWWENSTGVGTSWTAHTIGFPFDSAVSVYAADVDGDGDIDVLGAAANANDITWWENLNGAGTSWTTHTIDGDFDGAFSVYAADVDGDGDLDVLGAGRLADEITWWQNLNGAGASWTAHTIDTDFDGAVSVYAADVDGDGDLDVLGAARAADDITWWENLDGVGTSWTAHAVEGDFDLAHSVHAADLDGDGDIDVLGAAAAAGDITWWENKTIHRNSVFSTRHTIDGLAASASVYAADVDGDGDLDVLGAEIWADSIKWWENPGGMAATDGTPWTERTIDDAFDGAISVHAADLDGDGDPDVLGAALDGDAVAWWENPGGTATIDGTSWTMHTIDGAFDGAVSVFAADVDGDGNLDVLGASLSDRDITWWRNPGGTATTDGTSWTEHTIDDDFDGASSVYAADIDRDGDLDLLGTAYYAHHVSWWENPGSTATTDGTPWIEHTIDGNYGLPRSVHAADLDGDGDVDVLATSVNFYTVTWWENPGGAASTDGTHWIEHTVNDYFQAAYFVRAADLDGDGDLDVLGAAAINEDITWWENPGGAATTDGTPWAEHRIYGFLDGALSVHAADLDSDGDLDVLGAPGGDIAWWENRGGQFALPTASLAASPVAVPAETAVLQIHGVHNGRVGDTDVELVTFELLFDNGATPLTNAQANSAVENLRVYRDDGSGDFDANDDFLVLTVSSLSLTAGVQQLNFADGNTDAQVVFGAPQRYFVILDLISAGLVNMLRVTHLTESSSTAEDRDHDIPLKLEFSFNTSTPLMVLEDGPEAACPPDLVRANQTLSGTQTLKATSTATLGPNLIADGTDIAIDAPEVSILPETSISGVFSVGNNPACP